jgi:ectoine hydroxylase-related dioxygenase (phytanoyl-CoA dioxygenase family)
MRVVVKIEGDIRILPIWLDYHKHIFESGLFIVRNDFTISDKNTIKHIVSRFFVNCEFADTYLSTDNLTMILSINEFLLDYDDLYTQLQYESGVLNHTTFYRAKMREHPFPNNVLDFLTTLSLSLSEYDSFDIKLLSMHSENQSNIASTVNATTATTVRSGENLIQKRINELEKTDYIYYLDAYIYSDYNWGDDRVILLEDTNLLENTDFNVSGHCIFSMKSYNGFLQKLIETKIQEITYRQFDIAKYHLNISDGEHTKIINAMPWKKTESPEMLDFSEYIETRVSEIIGRKVKIFNDDIWIRICRPSTVTETDYNPCHRDIYLDFYRNIVNIYVPIVGSNEKSSLMMQSGSHLWNERDVIVTKSGAYFKNSDKKYSVDAILQSRARLNMTRPNPKEDEFILFSPYLIHGCSSNDNEDTTRMSVEIRFIEDNENAKMQEDAFNTFLKERCWR